MERGIETLRMLFYSTSKLKILELLKESQNDPKDLGDLSEKLGKTKQTLSTHLKTLCEFGLLQRVGDKYIITDLGKITYEKMNEVMQLLDAIAGLKDLLTHDLSPIPTELLADVRMLHGGWILCKSDPYELKNEWLEILFDSSWIFGLSSIYHPEFPKLFSNLSTSKEVRLILTESVFERVKRESGKYLQEFLSKGEMYVCKDFKLTFVVAEKGFTMNLYQDSYDAFRIFINRESDAIDWGLRLFNYYLAQSKRVEQ